MAKSYTVTAEMKSAGFDKGVANVKSQINSLKGLSTSLEKSFQVSGDFGKLKSGLNEASRGLKLAESEVKRLETALSVAHKFNMDTSGINKLETELNRAKTQVNQFEASMGQMKQSAVTGSSGFERASQSAKNMQSNLLDAGSKIGNIFTGISSGVNLVTGAIGTVSGVVGGFANSLMNTYDQQIGAQKTLSSVLSDGANGYKYFNDQIQNGSLLLKSQKGDLNEIGATLASYTQMTGESAFKTANAINAVGDSLSVNTEGQKQFSLALAQAMGSGALHAQDFNQMMQTALGANFKATLIEAANSLNGVKLTTDDLGNALKEGKISADQMSQTFGSDWANKMATAQSKTTGLKVSVGDLKKQFANGKIGVDQFTSVLGQDFTDKLLQAQNASGGMVVTQANFKQAMEDGAFSTDVMNKALEMFQQKGEEVANAGFSTFEQIRTSVVNGFNTSALQGFQDKANEVGGGMDNLGNRATEMASLVGQQAGQMAAEVINSLTNIIDKNGDHKLSEDEVKQAVQEVSKKVKKLGGDLQEGARQFGNFTSSIGQEIQPIIDAYNWLDNLISKANELSRNIGGKSGILGKLVGVDDWFSGSNAFGERGFFINPINTTPLTGIERFSIPMSPMDRNLPLNLQTFAGSPDMGGIANAITNVNGYGGGSGTQNITKTVIFQQTLMGKQSDDGGKAEIIKMLRKNGFEIKFT